MKKWLSALALGLLLCYTSFAQESGTGQLAKLLSCVNDQYGTDDYLVSGRPYQSSNPRADGYPNFQSGDWEEATLFIQGRVFDKSLLKYDLEKDVLALKRTLKNGAIVQVSLNSNMIDSFQIDEHLFVTKEDAEIGYVELIYQENWGFYQKHRKKFVTDVSISTPYGKYVEEPPRFYLFRGKERYEISGRNDFLSLFEQHKKAIKKYIKQNDIHLQKASRESLLNLCKYVDGL